MQKPKYGTFDTDLEGISILLALARVSTSD